MDWKEYAKELLIFQVKVFSLPIEDVSKEKIEEFKNEFNELKKWVNSIGMQRPLLKITMMR